VTAEKSASATVCLTPYCEDHGDRVETGGACPECGLAPTGQICRLCDQVIRLVSVPPGSMWVTVDEDPVCPNGTIGHEATTDPATAQKPDPSASEATS
jgi:hypothetical protein